jgi:hypothetical protein
MIEEFQLKETTEIFTQIHHQFQISVSFAISETLHLSKEEIAESIEAPAGTGEGNTGDSEEKPEEPERTLDRPRPTLGKRPEGETVVVGEMTVIEKQIIMWMVRVHLHLVKQEAFMAFL